MRAVQLSREELLDRQRSLNAPDSLLITSLFVIPPTIPSGDGSNRFTMVAVGLVLGLALGRGGSVSRMSAAPGGDAQPAWRSNHGGSSRLRSRRSHRWRHRRRTTRTRRRAGVDQPAVRPAAADRPPSTVGDKDEGAGQADETASKTGSPPTPDPIPVVGPQLPSTPATTATPGCGPPRASRSSMARCRPPGRSMAGRRPRHRPRLRWWQTRRTANPNPRHPARETQGPPLPCPRRRQGLPSDARACPRRD